MSPAEWALDYGPAGDEPTIFAHALSLSLLYGHGPWPDGGFPLPDEPQHGDERVLLPTVVLDGVGVRHFSVARDPVAVSDITGLIAALVTGEASRDTLIALHEAAGRVQALKVADALARELRERQLPRDRVRAIGRHLAECGTRRDIVKAGIVVIGVVGDERDHDLLMLLGALEEFTLYAVVALLNTQPDRQRTVFDLARRVTGWGRIHAVERLKDCDYPDVKAWLLRDGFRNDVMDEYLAHIAATTGDLYDALLSPVDEQLLDGAGAILAALAAGGPAEDMTDYDEAVPALYRYLVLAAQASPALDRICHVAQIWSFLDDAGEIAGWPEREKQRLARGYQAQLAEPAWRDVVSWHLADPEGTDVFNKALSCAGPLGIPALSQTLAYLRHDPLNGYAWQWALNNAGEDMIGQVVSLAELLLPLRDLGSGATSQVYGLGPEFQWDTILEVFVQDLDRHPGHGLTLIRTALVSRLRRTRRAALRTLTAWGQPPPEFLHWIGDAARVEPDEELRAELAGFLNRIRHIDPAG